MATRILRPSIIPTGLRITGRRIPMGYASGRDIARRHRNLFSPLFMQVGPNQGQGGYLATLAPESLFVMRKLAVRPGAAVVLQPLTTHQRSIRRPYYDVS